MASIFSSYFFLFNVVVIVILVFLRFSSMHSVNDVLGYLWPPRRQLNANRRRALRKRVVPYGVPFVIALWGLFIAVCIPTQSPFPTTYRGSIPNPNDRAVPFLDGQDYLSLLEKFKNKTVQDNILVVYGPKSHSKTRGIKDKCWEWENNGDVCVFIDLKSWPWEGNIFKYAKLVGSTTIAALQRASIPITSQIETKIVNHFRPHKSLLNLFMKLPGIKQLINKMVPNPYVNIADAMYEMVANNSQTNFDIVAHFEFLYDILEEISKEIAPKKLIFILSEVQQLNKIGDEGKRIWQRLYSDFGQKKGGANKAVHIIETSDTFFIIDEQIRENTASFELFQIKPLNKQHTKKEVVGKYKLINEREFEKAWEYLGGYSGGWFKFLTSIKSIKGIYGQTLDAPLHEMYLFYNKLFIGVLLKPPTMKSSKLSFLKKLANNGFAYAVPNGELDDATLDLVVKHILFWDGKQVTPQNGLFQYVISTYLKEIAQ